MFVTWGVGVVLIAGRLHSGSGVGLRRTIVSRRNSLNRSEMLAEHM